MSALLEFPFLHAPIVLRPTEAWKRERDAVLEGLGRLGVWLPGNEYLKLAFDRDALVEALIKAGLVFTKGNTYENDYLLLVFNNTDITNIGDAGGLLGSATAGSLYVGLHTADPGEAGDQTTSEATYTSYARVGVARAAGGWTVSANVASNTAAVTFPEATGGSNTITYAHIGAASTAAGKLMYSGALTASIAVSAGITPEAAIGAITVTED